MLQKAFVFLKRGQDRKIENGLMDFFVSKAGKLSTYQRNYHLKFGIDRTVLARIMNNVE